MFGIMQLVPPWPPERVVWAGTRHPCSCSRCGAASGCCAPRAKGRWAAHLQYLGMHCARSARAALPTAAVQVPLTPSRPPSAGCLESQPVSWSTGTLLYRQCELNRQMLEPAFYWVSRVCYLKLLTRGSFPSPVGFLHGFCAVSDGCTSHCPVPCPKPSPRRRVTSTEPADIPRYP